ncbi:pentapeptide repeat-containing protein [Euryarchaeota archaeon]|nr:pentapeptide repeat-containing protein [Euryarchaeota archaeon]
MHTKAIALILLIIASSLAGCTTSDDIETIDQDNRITELENKQLELVLSLAEQEQTNSDLLASISLIESANMQAIEALEDDYLDSLNELETSYLAAMEAAAVVNSQSLDEINSTNAASYDNLLLTMNTLQSNLQGSQDSINAIILTIDDMDSDDSGDSLAQILLLQQNLQDLHLDLESSIANLDSRLNMTRAMNDFSYLDFQGAQLFNFNNGLGIQMEPPIFDFAMLDNASLTYSNFSDASFVNANLVGADGIFSTFHRTDFSGAQMYQGIWRQSDFSDALFIGSQLAYTEFRYSDLSGANLSGAVAYGGSDWLMVNLSGADLTNAWMYDVDLRYADLTGADLTGARLAYLNPSYGPADITGVTWTNAICPDGTHASTVGNTCANNL